MLDAIFKSTGFAIGFIFFVIVLAGFYLLNRERAHVARMRGPRRFQPDWKRSRAGAPRRRRRSRGGAFQPDWSRGQRHEADRGEEGGEGPQSPESK